jgi:hypothetical protein
MVGQKDNGDLRKKIAIYGYFNLWAMRPFASKTKRFCNPQLPSSMARRVTNLISLIFFLIWKSLSYILSH